MKRRDFLRAAPIAVLPIAAATAVAVTPHATTIQRGLVDPNKLMWAKMGEFAPKPEEFGEPLDPQNVISVVMTEVGTLPAVEMIGSYVTNGDVLFEEVPWKSWCKNSLFQSKKTNVFLRLANAKFLREDHQGDKDVVLLFHGPVEVELVKHVDHAGLSLGFRPIENVSQITAIARTSIDA